MSHLHARLQLSLGGAGLGQVAGERHKVPGARAVRALEQQQLRLQVLDLGLFDTKKICNITVKLSQESSDKRGA
jgi:hypothetical protein